MTEKLKALRESVSRAPAAKKRSRSFRPIQTAPRARKRAASYRSGHMLPQRSLLHSSSSAFHFCLSACVSPLATRERSGASGGILFTLHRGNGTVKIIKTGKGREKKNPGNFSSYSQNALEDRFIWEMDGRQPFVQRREINKSSSGNNNNNNSPRCDGCRWNGSSV